MPTGSGVINKGEIILVEDKAELMRKLGRKQLTLQLQDTLERIRRLSAYNLELSQRAATWSIPYDEQGDRAGIAALLRPDPGGHPVQDLHTTAKLARGHFRHTGERQK